MTAASPGRERFAYFDGLRGWAALLVVFHHGMIALDFALYTGTAADSRWSWDRQVSGTPFVLLATAGNLAVCVFFALSGFVLAHAYSRSQQTWMGLAVRRYVRLAIPMLAACLLSWALLSLRLMHPHEAARITRSSWLASQFHQSPDLIAAVLEPARRLMGLPVGIDQTYDLSLWTMPIEAQASLALITMFVLFRHLGVVSDTVKSLAFCVLAMMFLNTYFSLLAFGAALRLFRPQPRPHRSRYSTCLLAALALLACFLGTVPYSAARWPIYDWMTRLSQFIMWDTWVWWRPSEVWRLDLWQHSPESFWHGLGALCIVLAVYLSPHIRAALSGPISRRLGRISFPLYVLQAPLLMVFECDGILLCQRAGFSPIASALLSAAVFVAASLTIAAALTPLIEGGAIRLSFLAGNAVDGGIRRLAHSTKSRLGLVSAGGADTREPPSRR